MVDLRRADLITEKLTDSFWCERNAHQAVTDPVRMVAVLQAVIALLRDQPRHEDEQGALSWAAWWLEEQLAIDATARREGRV